MSKEKSSELQPKKVGRLNDIDAIHLNCVNLEAPEPDIEAYSKMEIVDVGPKQPIRLRFCKRNNTVNPLEEPTPPQKFRKITQKTSKCGQLHSADEENIPSVNAGEEGETVTNEEQDYTLPRAHLLRKEPPFVNMIRDDHQDLHLEQNNRDVEDSSLNEYFPRKMKPKSLETKGSPIGIIKFEGVLHQGFGMAFSKIDELEKLNTYNINFEKFEESRDMNSIRKDGKAIICQDRPPPNEPCFVCASVGKPYINEKNGVPSIIHCSLCCQKYHFFCSGADINDETVIGKMKNGSWVCVNCAGCNVCKKQSKKKSVTCKYCKKFFHLDCLGTSPNPDENQSWTCLACVKCHSCASDIAGPLQDSQWKSEYTLCELCHDFKTLCKKCILCNSGHIDEVEGMLQCYKCRSWTHASCEDQLDTEEILVLTRRRLKYSCLHCSVYFHKQLGKKTPDNMTPEEKEKLKGDIKRLEWYKQLRTKMNGDVQWVFGELMNTDNLGKYFDTKVMSDCTELKGKITKKLTKIIQNLDIFGYCLNNGDSVSVLQLYKIVTSS